MAASLAAAPGCATITGSELQSILVSTRTRAGEPLEKAECTLRNPSGQWTVVTPGSVTVLRSAEDMQVECRRDGHPPGLAKLVSRAHGAMFGNIIFGGAIGALIDHSKGTGYEYPNLVVVTMGEIAVIDRRDEVGGARDAAAQERTPALTARGNSRRRPTRVREARAGRPKASRGRAPAPSAAPQGA
ncbi:MAG: hypothetical protein RML56_08710 [Burkholderiales bacterium]|nr:hypothetical protein [Burkholderiales bacterium]